MCLKRVDLQQRQAPPRNALQKRRTARWRNKKTAVQVAVLYEFNWIYEYVTGIAALPNNN